MLPARVDIGADKEYNMIRSRYESELKRMTGKLYLMLRKVEASIENSIKALEDHNLELAKEISGGDIEINKLERDIEQECLKLLLLEHPVAGDFREVSAALKMITDLERIGDQTRDICELILQFDGEAYIKTLEHIPEMGKIAAEMVKCSVHAYINRDLSMARSLDKYDDRVDGLFEKLKSELVALIRKKPSAADQAILFLMIGKYLERISDHAVNIGEWAEYAITGRLKGEPLL